MRYGPSRLCRALRSRRREPGGEGCKVVDESLEKCAHVLVGDDALRVHKVRLELDVGLSAHQMQTLRAQHGAQVLLRKCS